MKFCSQGFSHPSHSGLPSSPLSCLLPFCPTATSSSGAGLLVSAARFTSTVSSSGAGLFVASVFTSNHGSLTCRTTLKAAARSSATLRSGDHVGQAATRRSGMTSRLEKAALIFRVLVPSSARLPSGGNRLFVTSAAAAAVADAAAHWLQIALAALMTLIAVIGPHSDRTQSWAADWISLAFLQLQDMSPAAGQPWPGATELMHVA